MSAVAPQQQTFAEAAWTIGMQLCRDAVWAGRECNWLGDSMEPVLGEWRVVHRSFGPDLYTGTAGVAMFLARLARYGDEPLLRSTARAAIRHAHAHRDDIPDEARHALYSGWLGIAWAMFDVAEMLDDRTLVADAWRLVDAIRGRELPPMSLDIISGAAGVITALVGLFRRTGHPALIEEAMRHARFIINAANRDGDAWSWTTMPSMTDEPQKDLTGYSHGTAGIAAALLELHSVTGEGSLREAAERGIAYERRAFDEQQQNWPDYRNHMQSPQPERYPCGIAWCHGAPGIGLSRLRAYQLTGDASLRRDAEIAMQTTFKPLAQPTQYDNFSLCHGLFGNAELFLDASSVLNDPRQRAVAENVARIGIDGIAAARQPWPCGVTGGGETPGLMLGLAGIGWFLLRLHDPAVPSVLLVT